MMYLAVLLAATVPSQADTPAATKPAEAASAKVASQDKVVCKRTAMAGSKVKKKVCATAEQWDALAEHSIRTTRELQRNRGSTKGG